MNVRLTSHGAAREVTGSCHLVEVAGRRILLDCGMFQGGRERHERNREPFPFDPGEIDVVVLSHAHIDHCGRLPLLAKRGFRGPILATPPTVGLTRIMLADSGRIQEEDARSQIERLQKKHRDWRWVEPLYTEADAVAVMGQFRGVAFDTLHDVGAGITLRLVKAGHILGAAIVELQLGRDAGSRRLVFSGDLGVDGARLLDPPAHVVSPDWLIMESTYGDRSRPDDGDMSAGLREAIQRTVGRGGQIVIPAFAVGRTQAVLARINDLVEAGELPGLRVFVDSPMAAAATRVFTQHTDAYATEARRLLEAGDQPFEFPGLSFTSSVEESKAINEFDGPCVIISASGMLTGGRVKHHVKRIIGDDRNMLLFVGYQARGTLGRMIQSGVTPVRIHGAWYPVRAEIAALEGFSAHADRDGLIAWFRGLGDSPQHAFLVHGDEEAAFALCRELTASCGADVRVPEPGEAFELD